MYYVKKILMRLLEPLFGRLWLQSLYQKLHAVTLLGMGYGAGSDVSQSGELHALVHTLRAYTGQGQFVLFDVGANDGVYSAAAIRAMQQHNAAYSVHAFEPASAAFEKLAAATKDIPHVAIYPFGFGEQSASVSLYTDKPGSGMASVFARENLAVHDTAPEQIQLKTLDAFCRESGVDAINFLKIDVEGNELHVLLGARQLIAQGRIQYIQFEFGGTDIDARVYFRDFYRLLSPQYRLYRILQHGLQPVEYYTEIQEIFTTTNYLAELRGAAGSLPNVS